MKATYLAHGSSSNLRAPIGNGTNWCTNWCSHQPSTNIYGAIYRRINCPVVLTALLSSAVFVDREQNVIDPLLLDSGTPRPMMHGCTSVKHLGGRALNGRRQEGRLRNSILCRPLDILLLPPFIQHCCETDIENFAFLHNSNEGSVFTLGYDPNYELKGKPKDLIKCLRSYP